MTEFAKSAGSRLVRWCARLVGQNKPRQQKKPQSRWYDVDHCGLH
jgi:hypothetical protein